MKNIQIVKTPYVYENTFKNDNGDLINYSQLRVDVKVGEKKVHLTYKLKDIEAEYVKSLLSADEAFSENDIKIEG